MASKDYDARPLTAEDHGMDFHREVGGKGLAHCVGFEGRDGWFVEGIVGAGVGLELGLGLLKGEGPEGLNF